MLKPLTRILGALSNLSNVSIAFPLNDEHGFSLTNSVHAFRELGHTRKFFSPWPKIFCPQKENPRRRAGEVGRCGLVQRD